MALPHLYKKLLDLARQYDRLNQDYLAGREDMRRELSSKFRLSKRDTEIAMRELEREERARKINRRKIRLL